MKKQKAFHSILGLIAITPVIAPILTSCGGKQSEELKVTIEGQHQGVNLSYTTPKKNAPWTFTVQTEDTYRASSLTIKVGSKILSVNEDYVINFEGKTVTIKQEAMIDNVTIVIDSSKESIVVPTISDQYAFYDYETSKYYVTIDGFSCSNIDIENELNITMSNTTASSTATFSAKAIKKSGTEFSVYVSTDCQYFETNGYDIKMTISTPHSSKLVDEKAVKFWIMPVTPHENPTESIAAGDITTLETGNFATAVNKSTKRVLDLNTFLKLDDDESNVSTIWYIKQGVPTPQCSIKPSDLSFVPSTNNTSIIKIKNLDLSPKLGYVIEARLFLKEQISGEGNVFKYTLTWTCTK